MIRLWATTLLDFVHSVIEEYMQKETDMTKSKLIRLSGWSLMLGAIAFLSGLSILAFNNTLYGYMYWNPFLDVVFGFGIFIGPIFIAMGLLGLRACYGGKIGSGKNILLLGAVVGGSTFIVIDLIQILTPNYNNLRFIHLYIFLGGALFMFLCLFIFGILAAIKKPLPRWNTAPLTAGGIWVAVAPILVWTFTLHSLTKNIIPSLIFIASQIVITVSLLRLGYVLQSDSDRETTFA